MNIRMWGYFNIFEVVIYAFIIIVYWELCKDPFLTPPWKRDPGQGFLHRLMHRDRKNNELQSNGKMKWISYLIRAFNCVVVIIISLYLSLEIFYHGIFPWDKILQPEFLYNRLQLNNVRIIIVLVSANMATAMLIVTARMTGDRKYRYTWKEILLLLIQALVAVLCYRLLSGAPRLYRYEKLAVYSRIEVCMISVSGIVAMIVFDQYIAGKKREKEVLELEKEISENYNYYHNQEQMQEEIRRMYHDMKKHFQVLGSMSDVHEIHNYVNSMYEEVKVAEGFYHTGNRIADIILNEKKQKAEEQDTVLEIVVENNCLNLLEPVHICTILSNILDNALEACVTQTQEKRYIRMKIFGNEQGLFINLKNSMEQEPMVIDGHLISRKLDGLHHGLGMNSVKSAVKKYGGEMQMDWNQNTFHILIMMPVVQE